MNLAMSIDILRPPLAIMYLPQTVAIGSVGPSCRKILMMSNSTFSSSTLILWLSIAGLPPWSPFGLEGKWLTVGHYAVLRCLISLVGTNTSSRLASYRNSIGYQG